MSKGVLRRERDVEENVRSAAALGLQDHMNCTQSCVQLLLYVLSYFLNFINVSFSPFED